MKSLFFCTLFLASTALFGNEYSFSPKSSQISWEGTKVVGGGHQGTLNLKSGFMKFKDNKPTEAQVVVDMSSIKNTDLTDPKWNKKLVDHLHSNDFFATSKYPEAKIIVDKFALKKDDLYKLEGKLTIKGITKPVSFDGKLTGKSGMVSTLAATLVFDRTDFNVKYGSGKFFDNLGDKMISDNVKVDVKLNLVKPKKTASN